MNIKLKHRYKGPLSNYSVLQPGEYNGSDLPDGLAEYLVENDHAVVLGSNIARAIDVVQAASTEVKQAIASMLERDLSEEAQEDSLAEARAEYEKETLEEKQADLAEMLADDLSLSNENFQEDDPDEILEKVEDDDPEDKPKRGRPKKQ